MMNQGMKRGVTYGKMAYSVSIFDLFASVLYDLGDILRIFRVRKKRV